MDEPMPTELEERIRYYEHPDNDPGPLTAGEWRILLATGVLLPLVCLLAGWFLGWPS